MRFALIPAITLLVLFSSASARAQISPRLLAVSSKGDTGDVAVPLERVESFQLEPASNVDRLEQIRPRLGKMFWVAWGLAGAFSVASVEMTVHCERLPGCSEGNPLFGPHPGRAELYAPRAAVIAAALLFARHWKRRNPGDSTPAITICAIDSIWGIDTAWDARRIATIPQARDARVK